MKPSILYLWLISLPFSSITHATAVPCDFYLTHTKNLTSELGVVINGDNQFDFISAFNKRAFVVRGPTSLSVFTDGPVRKFELPKKYEDYEVSEVSEDVTWARLVRSHPWREVILNLQTMTAARTADIPDDQVGLTAWHLIGRNSLLQIDYRTRTIAIFDLSRDFYRPVAKGPFVVTPKLIPNDFKEAMGSFETIKWRVHFDENSRLLYLVPRGAVEDPAFIRLSILGHHLKTGFSFKLPVPEGVGLVIPPKLSASKAKRISQSYSSHIPPEVIKTLFERPKFAVSPHGIVGVRFVEPDFVDILTVSVDSSPKMTSTIQRFSRATGDQIFKLNLPSGFRGEHFIVDPTGRFALATGDQLSEGHSIDLQNRTPLLILARTDLQPPMVVKKIPLAELISREAGVEEPYIVQSIWRENEVTLMASDLKTYTFKVE